MSDPSTAADDDAPAAGVPAIDAARYRTVLGHFCSGIVVITAQVDGQQHGFTAQSFTSLSLDPPLVLFCPGKSSASGQAIVRSGAFCANVLDAEAEDLSRVFSSKEADKFSGIAWKAGPSGAPVLERALATIDCTIEAVHDGGDHNIVVGRVLELSCRDDGAPLLYFRGGYRTLAV